MTRSYKDFLRSKDIHPPTPLHTEKKPGDWIMTGTGFYRVGEKAHG